MKEQGSPEKRLTSEQRIGICPQPRETCPSIDEAIGVVEHCQKEMRGYANLDEEGLRDLVYTIEYELAKLVGFRGQGMLENLRKANASIREWGEEWKQQALEWEPKEIEA